MPISFPVRVRRRVQARRLAFWLSLLFAIGLLFSTAPAASPPPWPHAQSDLKPDPGLIFGRLDNGLRYILMVNRTPKDRVSLHLNVQVGSLQEEEDQQGMAHFLEHMLFNGSQHFPPGELVKYFQRIGMAYGADVNAHTGFDETVYRVILPDGRRESLAEGLLVLSDYARGALLDPTEIDSERQVVLAEMRTRDSPGYRTYKATMGFEFEGLNLARRLPIGERKVIESVDRSRLKGFYDTWYRPERMVVVAAGDFDPRTVEELIRLRFADWGALPASPPDPPQGLLDHRGVKVFYHPEPELGHVGVRIQQMRQIPPEVDSSARQRRELAEEMADRILDHRLEAILTRPDPPFTRAGSASGVFLKTLHYAEISAHTKADRWAETLARLEQTLRQALEHGFEAAEVERVGREYLAELDLEAGQAATRESPDLARQIIDHLNDNRVMMAPEAERDLLAPMIRSMGPEALHQALRRAWSADHWLVLVTGSVDLSGGSVKPAQRIEEVFAESRSRPVEAPAAMERAKFPYLPLPSEAGKVVERIAHPDLGVTQVAFANGVRLSLKPTKFKADEVLVSLDLEPGRSAEPPESPGLAEVAERLLNTGGLGAMTREALDRALAGSNVAANLTVTEDRIRLKGVAVRGQVGLLFELLRHRLLDPGWRQTDLDLVMARFGEQYADWTRSVDGQMALFGRRFLAGGDSRFGLPPLADLRSFSLDQVRRWVEPILSTAPIELAVVGDFDVNQVIDLTARLFGSLPERRPLAMQVRPGPQFPAGGRLDLRVDTQIEKALVVVAFATEDQWDIQRTRRLNMLADVFSDRLREQIREKLGASYNPSVHPWASRAYAGYGVMTAYIPVDPTQVETVVQAVEGIAADLAANGIDADAFLRSREPTLTGIKDILQENGYWLNTVLAGAWRHPQQLDWCRTIVADHAAIEAQTLSALAARYLTPGRRAVVRIVPGPGAKTDAS